MPSDIPQIDTMAMDEVPVHIVRRRTFKGWIRHFRDTYTPSSLALLMFVYFNMGFRVLFMLTMKDLFKNYLHLEPAEAQYFTSCVTLPWSFKIFIGTFIDNVPIAGSRRTAYIKISGVVMAVCLIALQLPFISKL